MSNETTPNAEVNQSRGVFPIDAAIMHNRVSFRDELTAEEQQALHDGNLESLADNDPLRYLLEGSARPQLQDADRHDYNSGVMVAFGAVQRQKRLLRSEGIAVPEPSFDPEADGPAFYLPRPNPSQSFLLRGISYRLREATHIYGRVNDYVDTGGHGLTMSLRSLITRRQQLADMPFVSQKQFDVASIDALALGMGDAFQLYYGLYGGDFHHTKVQLEWRRRLNAIKREDVRDHWREAGIPRVEMYNRDVGYLRERHTVPTYRAVMEHATIPADTAADTKPLRANVWWNGVVPAGARVTHVGSIDSRTVMSRSESGRPQPKDIGDRETGFERPLQKTDVLLVRGADKQFYNIHHPFVIDPAIARQLEGFGTTAVEIVRLCSYGQVHKLLDERAWRLSSDPDLIRLTNEAIDYQRRTIRAAHKIRRLIFEGNQLPMDIVESASMLSASDIVAGWQHWPHLPTNLGTMALMWLYVKYYKQRPLGVPKLQPIPDESA